MLTVVLMVVGAFLLGMLVGDVMGDMGRTRREADIWNAAVMDTLRMVEDDRNLIRWVRPVWQDDPPPPPPPGAGT
jgi:hypothetical protein